MSCLRSRVPAIVSTFQEKQEEEKETKHADQKEGSRAVFLTLEYREQNSVPWSHLAWGTLGSCHTDSDRLSLARIRACHWGRRKDWLSGDNSQFLATLVMFVSCCCYCFDRSKGQETCLSLIKTFFFFSLFGPNHWTFSPSDITLNASFVASEPFIIFSVWLWVRTLHKVGLTVGMSSPPLLAPSPTVTRVVKSHFKLKVQLRQFQKVLFLPSGVLP